MSFRGSRLYKFVQLHGLKFITLNVAFFSFGSGFFKLLGKLNFWIVTKILLNYFHGNCTVTQPHLNCSHRMLSTIEMSIFSWVTCWFNTLFFAILFNFTLLVCFKDKPQSIKLAFFLSPIATSHLCLHNGIDWIVISMFGNAWSHVFNF